MNDTERIHPLKDVWLRPRRVFRELAREPLTRTDFLLAALQGICNYLVVQRLQPDPKLSLAMLLSNALFYGSATGLLATWFYTLVYARLGARVGRVLGRQPMFHVLTYGGVPVVAGLLLWLGSALLVGETVLIPPQAGELDGFVLIVDRLQVALRFLCYLWSYLLQVMGLSELFGVNVGRAFGLWVLGQVVGGLAAIFLKLLLMILFPSLAASG